MEIIPTQPATSDCRQHPPSAPLKQRQLKPVPRRFRRDHYLGPSSRPQAHCQTCSRRSPSLAKDEGQPASVRQAGNLFLELFAGTARMSKALSRIGFQVLAVDSVKAPAAPSLSLDLSKKSNQRLTLILDLIQSQRPAAVHLAPPCGTSSQKHLLAQACL